MKYLHWNKQIKNYQLYFPGWWRGMTFHPVCHDVWVLMRDGSTKVAHWAEDLGGEEQPPFTGWFVAVMTRDYECGGQKLSYYSGIEKPVAWRPL
jgi:hypothetical protein